MTYTSRFCVLVAICFCSLSAGGKTFVEFQEEYDKAPYVTSSDDIEGRWLCARSEAIQDFAANATSASCGSQSENIYFRNDAGKLIGNLSEYHFSEGTFALNTEGQMTSQLKCHQGTSSEMTYTAHVKKKTDKSLIIFLEDKARKSSETIAYYGPFLECELKERFSNCSCVIL
jgi:hypothetical protein